MSAPEHEDWAELVARAGPSLSDLRSQVDLVGVCLHYGVSLDEGYDGRWTGLCPFHDDHRPSFSVYLREDGSQACGCFACPFGPSNDVFDFLRRFRGYGLAEAAAEVRALAAAGRMRPPPVRPAEASPSANFRLFVDGARRRAEGRPEVSPLGLLFESKGRPSPPAEVTTAAAIGATPDGQGVVIPHFDRNGEVTGVKIRRPPDWTMKAVLGSRFPALYGAWRDKGHPHVLLAEGESDTLTASYRLRDTAIDVFGLPTGAAAHPRQEWLDHLAGRVVTLCFDADDAGRSATERWVKALGGCYVATLDEGEDISSSSAERFLTALANPVYATAAS